MGLYLCVFDGDQELDGVDVGYYDDFHYFRTAVVERFEGKAGSKCPTLIYHSDCDGEWTSRQCVVLKAELEAILAAFQTKPPIKFNSEWQVETANSAEIRPVNLAESFIDVDGKFLIGRLMSLCDLAIARNLSILFQ